MKQVNRRQVIQSLCGTTAALATAQLGTFSASVFAQAKNTDSLPMQLYKSLNDEQREKVCSPINDPKRQYVSGWWYIHPDHRIPNTFNDEQQKLIQKIFDSLHSEEYMEDVRKQVKLDTYGNDRFAPAVGFFGTPKDNEFEFIYTGHHVTRRCNVHGDRAQGFGGNPIFYGHYPHPMKDGDSNFHEGPEHPGNPYWYQGRIFNQFVQSLDGKQQRAGLVSVEPRSEEAEVVVKKTTRPPGLKCSELASDQKKKFIQTMRDMMAMFRKEDVDATIGTIAKKNVVDRLHVSWYGGKYDVGSDQVWDTWQIEGPDMVWYFRGVPHIHCYFHLKS